MLCCAGCAVLHCTVLCCAALCCRHWTLKMATHRFGSVFEVPKLPFAAGSVGHRTQRHAPPLRPLPLACESC